MQVINHIFQEVRKPARENYNFLLDHKNRLIYVHRGKIQTTTECLIGWNFALSIMNRPTLHW